MKIIRKAGDTSTILQIFIQDSSSTTGAGLTGLVFNTAGLTAYYHRDTDTTATAITLVTMTVGTFTSSGFKEIDSTNMPGWYQFCPPDAALAAGAKSVGFHLKGATNMAPLPIEMQLTAFDLQTATVALAPLDSAVLHNGTCQSGSTADTVVLSGSASATDNLYVNQTVRIYSGTGIGQSRKMLSYTGSTQTAFVDCPWVTIPDNTSKYAVIGDGIQNQVLHAGLAVSATSTTIVLQSNAPGGNNIYNGQTITIVRGTGVGETRIITGYIASTQTATIDRAWTVTPDSTSCYVIAPADAPALNTSLNPTVGAYQSGQDPTTLVLSQPMVELTSVPAITATVLQALTWLFEMSRNKITQTATTQLLLKDDSSTTLATSTVADDGTTFSRTKFS